MATKGPRKTLYSVWLNSDDRLLILDGTAEQCAEEMGVAVNAFYKYVGDPKYQQKFTIRKTQTKARTRK